MRGNYLDLTSYLSGGKRQSKLLGAQSTAHVNKNWGAKVPRADRLRQFVECVGEAPEGADVIDRLRREDVLLINTEGTGLTAFCALISMQNSADQANRTPCIVGLEGELDDIWTETNLLHELKHAAQQGAASDSNAPCATDISEAVLSQLTVEADSSITEVIYAYQRHKQGKPELWNDAMSWNSERDGALPPLCQALLRQVESGYPENCDETRRAMFTAWMSQSALRMNYERDTLTMLVIAEDADTGMFTMGKHCAVANLPNFVRKPDGTSYLDGFDFSDRYISGFWNRPRGKASDPEAVAAVTAEYEAWKPISCLLMTLGALQSCDVAAATLPETISGESIQIVQNCNAVKLIERVITEAHAEGRFDDLRLIGRIAHDFTQLAETHPSLGKRLNEIGATAARRLKEPMALADASETLRSIAGPAKRQSSDFVP